MTTDRYIPQPGDIGLTKIKGSVGWLIDLGQFIIRDESRYSHAFVVLDDETVLEAMPGGAIITPLENYSGYNKDGNPVAVYLQLPLTQEQRYAIVSEARPLVGIPYSFLDYFALAAERFGLKTKWIKNYVADTGHMICSQLADEVYKRAGIQLFRDGRLPQDVTPGDLTYVQLEN
jgi:uncharacterized protein YycO